jgi:hypothetical protein
MASDWKSEDFEGVYTGNEEVTEDTENAGLRKRKRKRSEL